MKSLKTYISILKSVKNRPTKYFVFLVIAIVSLFLQAFMHNYNIVYLVMFFLVGIAGASSVFGVINLYHIRVKLLSHERFFATKTSQYKLLLINDSDNSSFDINILSGNQTQHIKVIEAHESVTVPLDISFAKRGEVGFEDIKLFSLFPLPHELKYKYIQIDKKVVVYAKPAGMSLLKKYNKNISVNGEIDEFEGIEKFNQGDSVSAIHWASLAKNNSLMSKKFTYEDESKKLKFDFKALQGETEERLSQLTLWVLESEKYNFDFTMKLGEKSIDSNKMSINEILEAIARY